jgi:predicted DNA-binding transcriptional regulator AlpA
MDYSINGNSNGEGQGFALRGDEAARYLNISKSMIYKLCRTDKSFPKGAKFGKVRVWLRRDLEAWAARKAGR